MKNRAGLFVCVLIVLWSLLLTQARALTLGDLRGAAILGRSLDVSVQVQTSQGEEFSAACVSAEVFFADAPQMAPVVTVGAMTGSLSEVRIQSSAMVNEPVVMVMLQATCGSRTTRRYVLLADFPKPLQASDAQPLVAQISSVGQTTTVSQTPISAMLDSAQLPISAKLIGSVKPSTATPKPKRAVNVKNTTQSPAPQMSDPKGRDELPSQTLARHNGKAVLKLDPLEIFSDRMDKLDSLMLFEPTEDALKQTKQITALQDDLKAMRELASKNDAQLAALRSQLEQAQTQQIPIWLVYALLGFSVFCLAVLGWQWRKQRQSQKMSDWWQHEDVPSTILMPPIHSEKASEATEVARKPAKNTIGKPTSTAVIQSQTIEKASAVKPAQAAPEVDLDIDLDSFMLSDKKSASSPSAPSQPVPVRGIHHINAESILDIRQQAEFFMSLGQTDRALKLLKLQIDEAAEPNPMVYLDLISLYHSLGMKTDFRELRESFQNEFNARMPDFPAFNVAGKELEDYPEVLEKLAPMWPQPQTLGYLDTCIFHDPLVQVRPMFELNAFRELLLLHALAEDINADLPSLGYLSATFESPSPIKTSTALEPSTPLALDASAAPLFFEVAQKSTQNPAQDEAHGANFSFGADNVDEMPNSATNISLDTTASTPVDESQKDQEALPEEPPTSMMLDLDFSSLAMPASAGLQSADESAPINHPPVRYATRSRLPVIKKSK